MMEELKEREEKVIETIKERTRKGMKADDITEKKDVERRKRKKKKER